MQSYPLILQSRSNTKNRIVIQNTHRIHCFSAYYILQAVKKLSILANSLILSTLKTSYFFRLIFSLHCCFFLLYSRYKIRTSEQIALYPHSIRRNTPILSDLWLLRLSTPLHDNEYEHRKLHHHETRRFRRTFLHR